MRRECIILLALTTLMGCSSPSDVSTGQSPSQPSQTTQSAQQNDECPDGIIDWENV